MNGCDRVALQSYIDEFIWRTNNGLVGDKAFKAIVRDVGIVYQSGLDPIEVKETIIDRIVAPYEEDSEGEEDGTWSSDEEQEEQEEDKDEEEDEEQDEQEEQEIGMYEQAYEDEEQEEEDEEDEEEDEEQEDEEEVPIPKSRTCTPYINKLRNRAREKVDNNIENNICIV